MTDIERGGMMNVKMRMVSIVALAALAGCSHGSARTATVRPPASSLTSAQPSGSALGASGAAPAIDLSAIDAEFAGLNADLTGADQGLNSPQEGDVNR